MSEARTTFEAQSTHTRLRLTFWSHEGDGFSGVVDGFHPEFGHLIGAQTSKTMGSPVGQFSITVKKPQEKAQRVEGYNNPGIGDPDSWLRLWQDPEGTWVFLQWVCDGEVIDGMLGTIDTVTENTSHVGMARNETYTISCSDAGKPLQQTVTYVNPYDDGAASMSVAAIYQRLNHHVVGPPGGFIRALLEAWIGNYEENTQTWLLPAGMGAQTYYELLQKNIGCMDEAVDGFIADPTILDIEGDGKNLWSLLQQYTNGMMNELIYDLAPPAGQSKYLLSGLVPTLTLRRKPFRVRGDTAKWDALPIHRVDLRSVKMRQIAKGGPAQRFNYWIMGIAGRQGIELQSALQGRGGTPGLPGSIPIWNLTSIEKHGFRMWQQATDFLPITKKGSGDTVAVAANWLRRCHDWHAPAPMELSGTITTSRIRPEIRIGHRVAEVRNEKSIDYYVEAVSNTWQMGAAGSTTLTLSRGEYADEDLLEVVYEELESRISTFRVSAVDASGDITGDNLTEEDDNSNLVSETQGFTSVALERTLDEIDDWLAPSERDAALAFEGLPEQTLNNPNPEAEVPPAESAEFDQEALEGGDPIPLDELGSDDPLFGLDPDDPL